MRRRDAHPDPEAERALRELDAALAGEPAADPELTLLVADVRAARPQADAPFLASLDARVHAGFPREQDTPKRGPSWRERFLRPNLLVPSVAGTLVAAVVVVGIATGGGGGGGVTDRASSGSASSSAGTAEDSAASTSGAKPAMETQSSAPAAKAAPSPTPAPSAPSSAPRKVERAADLRLTPAPDKVQETADGVVRATQASGGYVQTSSIEARDDGGTASFTLRIPSAKLDDTLASLSKLAHVGALNQSSTDITAQTASAADRLSDARAERRALLQALGRATTDRPIASLKARLRDNRSEIAQRQGALDAQRRRADLATVTVEIDSAGQAAAPKDDGAWTPRDALHEAGRVLEVVAGVALIALAILVPLAILGALAALAAHAVRRRRREAALDGAR